ncbi:MAG: FHA domain-containing protein [Solirubrobacterales bacterium]
MLETQPGPPDALKRDKDGSVFRRHSIFEQPTAESLPLSRPNLKQPDWLQEARDGIEERGLFIAFHEGGRSHVIQVTEGWTRIGRSSVADIRLDDASVSRRHALIVLGERRSLRVLDDRSLNGVYVNGERVDWAALEDGDELRIGRFRLFVVDSELAEAPS